MSDEDFETAHNLSKWDRPITLPLLHRLNVINVDDKILLLALVVDLTLGSVSTRHLKNLECVRSSLVVGVGRIDSERGGMIT